MHTLSDSCQDCEFLRNKLSEKDREIAVLLAQIDILNNHDPLTCVLNRRSIIAMLDAELQRSHRTGHPFSFGIIAIDRSDEILKLHGAATIDLILKSLADIAMKIFRSLDRFGRIDDIEFGILLPATWLEDSLNAFIRLRTAVAAFNWESIAPKLTVTFSVGITTNAPGDTSNLVSIRAKNALQNAQSAGGNTTVQAEEQLPDVSL